MHVLVWCSPDPIPPFFYDVITWSEKGLGHFISHSGVTEWSLGSINDYTKLYGIIQ